MAAHDSASGLGELGCLGVLGEWELVGSQILDIGKSHSERALDSDGAREPLPCSPLTSAISCL